MEDWDERDSLIELEDENGRLHRFFMVYDHLMAGGKQYVVLLPEEERNSDEPLVVILRLDRENEEYVLHNITDDAEWELVSRAWEEVEMEELVSDDEEELEEDEEDYGEDEYDEDEEDEEYDEDARNSGGRP